jgi:hypothetical protein
VVALFAGLRFDSSWNVVRALTGPEFDDAKLGEAFLAERILPDDLFDVLPALADREDDPAIPRYLSTRNQKMAGRIIFIQNSHVRGHVRVDFGQVGPVDQLDDEHGPTACIKSLPTTTSTSAVVRFMLQAT